MECSPFKRLGLNQWLVDQCLKVGIRQPTPIQQHCLPAILAGRDCIGCAKTGSGKTLAFALPILQTLSQDPYGIYALVLTPTRELALQIADQFAVMGKPINIKLCVVIGGKDIVKQAGELANRPHVVIATPGRLADHLRSASNERCLKKVKYLVLDEADRMLDGGFNDQLSQIFAALPDSRQTLLFSATVSDSIRQLQSISPSKTPFFWQEVSQDEEQTVQQLDQSFVLTPAGSEDAYLVHLIRTYRASDDKGLVMVFTKTCRQCELVSKVLTALGFPSVSLHSMKSQSDRISSLTKFRSHLVRILVATDVASRGLDIPSVQMVINHNVPSVSKDYVHRVGRTARAGKNGQAITLVTQTDVKLVHSIEKLIGVQLKEKMVDEKAIADIHAQVGVTKREQDIQLMDNDFDERRNIYKRKRCILEGLDPDVEEKKKNALRKQKSKQSMKEAAK